MIRASSLAERGAAGSRTTPMTTRATTAGAATSATARSPPNDEVSAGAATSARPSRTARWCPASTRAIPLKGDPTPDE